MLDRNLTQKNDLPHARLPESRFRSLLQLTALVEEFKPVVEHGDERWQFFLKAPDGWKELSVTRYRKTWYITLATPHARNHTEEISVTFDPATTASTGLEKLSSRDLNFLCKELAKIMKAVELDPAQYHKDLCLRLPPTHKYGLIHRALVRQLMPEWMRYDQELGDTALRAAIKLLEAPAPLPIQKLTAGTYFEYVKAAYAANRSTFQQHERELDLSLPARELYIRWADGRDAGLRDVPLRSVEGFRRWYDSARHGAHPFEIFRGGNSTHIDLHVERVEGDSWRLSLSAFSSTRLVETCRALLALNRDGKRCDLIERESYLSRLRGEDLVGIVPAGSDLRYGWQSFPKEFGVADVITFDHFRDEAGRTQSPRWSSIVPLVSWLPIRPVLRL